MKNRRYVLVIMDSACRHVRRVTLSRRTLELTGGIALLALSLALGALIHALVIRQEAAETLQIRKENQELHLALHTLEDRLPAAQVLATRAELTFAQLWAKSGLGLEPRLLGVGPLEAAQLEESGVPSSLAGDRLLSTETIALPLELDRIESTGHALQSALGETLEYFHDADLLLANTPSVRPAHTPWLTSSFGKRRDPIFNFWVMHKGLDMGGRIGMEVCAPADGVVIWTGLRGGYGKTVVLDHGYGLQTHFAHLNRYLVQRGDHVRRGDPIAEMGSTGKSTGPHLHYEVRRNGQPVDPRRFILD